MRQPLRAISGLVVHVAFAAILVWVAAGPVVQPSPAPVTKAVVWQPTPGQDGGGGGGDGRKAPPLARRTVTPVATPQFVLPRVPDVLNSLVLPGTVVVAAGLDRPGPVDGTGSDGRGEGREGPGSGPGRGPGTGPGDGPFVDGTPGLTSPQLVFERRPEYTAEAMSARIQGAVLLEATVLVDGSVSAVRIVRSIDPSFGLDRKAIEAIRAWRFRPGTYQGRPVPVKVLVELIFTLR
jgi:protein TonB